MSSAETIQVEHPGTFIVEELEARGWTQVDLAYILGKSPQELSPLLNGRKNITPDWAHALGEAFDVPAEFFANLQNMYDLSRARRPDRGVRTRAAWVSVFPIRQMIARGWIEDTEPDLLHLQMLRFFGVNDVEDIPFIGTADVAPLAARKTASKDAYRDVTPVQYVWLHRVKRIAEQMACPLYDENKLRAQLGSIRAHMLDKDDLARIPHLLMDCGVRFVLVEALPGSKIDGVCVWLGVQPVIGMSLRLNRMDNFCFVLRHEIEHVLKEHGKFETFTPVDEFDYDTDGADGLPEDEVIANSAASEFLIPRAALNSFILRKSPYISEKDVLAFAARMEVHPAIVVGQIHNKTKNYAWLRKYLSGVRDYIVEWKFRDGWNHQSPTGL